MISLAQMRVARAALGLRVRELAERSNVAEFTIHRFEAKRGGMQTATLERLQGALEAAGVIFVSADASGRLVQRERLDICVGHPLSGLGVSVVHEKAFSPLPRLGS